jgi:hypothetical protein
MAPFKEMSSSIFVSKLRELIALPLHRHGPFLFLINSQQCKYHNSKVPTHLMKRQKRVGLKLHAVTTLSLRASDSLPSSPNRLMPKKTPQYLSKRRFLDGVNIRCRKVAVTESSPFQNCSAICLMCNYLVPEISVNSSLCFGITIQTAPLLELGLCSLAFNEIWWAARSYLFISGRDQPGHMLQRMFWAGRCREIATASVANQTRQQRTCMLRLSPKFRSKGQFW